MTLARTISAATTLVISTCILASCAGSLEQIVESRHQLRIEQANANRPITHGASDGFGAAIAESAPNGLSLNQSATALPAKANQ